MSRFFEQNAPKLLESRIVGKNIQIPTGAYTIFLLFPTTLLFDPDSICRSSKIDHQDLITNDRVFVIRQSWTEKISKSIPCLRPMENTLKRLITR